LTRLKHPKKYIHLSKVIIVELLSGADMITRFLRDEGVEYIYGYPGGAALHIYDALFNLILSKQ
jgi:hypothetical protein